MTTIKQIKDLVAGEPFKLKEDAKRVYLMGYPSADDGFYSFKRAYNRQTQRYTCVPSDDTYSGYRDFKGDKQVFVGFD